MPAPLTGALFVRNNTGKPNRKSRRARSRKSTRSSVGRRRNGLPKGVRRNPRTGRFVSTSARKNRGSSRRRTSSRRHRTNRGRGRSFSRGRRGHRRNTGASSAIPGTAMLTRTVKKLPVLGPRIAPFVTPALGGALAFIPLHFALKYGGRYIPQQVRPFAYTLGGLTIATAAAMFPKVTRRFKGLLGTTVVVAGAIIDAFRYASGNSQSLGEAFQLAGYGDGGAYDIVPLAGSDMGGLYSDAQMGDAYYSGADISDEEYGAAQYGAPYWRRMFQSPPRSLARVSGPASRHAGRPGHRWGWLINLIGFEKFRALTALAPERRVALIHKLRTDAIATVDASMAQGTVNEDTSGLAFETGSLGGLGFETGALMFAGAAY